MGLYMFAFLGKTGIWQSLGTNYVIYNCGGGAFCVFHETGGIQARPFYALYQV